jgi:glycosyltransferase involved in cell wall biosynthesis
MEPLVSIIVPIYNVEIYLAECIDSILRQTYEKLEIILVDDGSPDHSGMICDNYAKKDARIVVIHKENGGLSDARNAGIDKSKGDILAFIDSDDYISPVFIETMVAPIISGKCDLTALKSSTSFYDGENAELATSMSACEVRIYSGKEVLERMLYQNIATGAPFKVCKREIFSDIRFPKGYLYEDVATTYKEFFVTKNAAIIDGSLYAYRERSNSITHQKFNKNKMIVLKIHEQLINDPNLVESDLISAATARVYQMVFNVFLQVPVSEKKLMKELWKVIKHDRTIILKDKSPLMKKKNCYGAIISYAGMNLTHFIGNLLSHH